jgi:Type IV secretion-system coupling protein DNA-binding domain/TrbL/VirB6 plasmid conjugal transfer protein
VGFFETFWSWLEGQLAAYIGTNTALVAAALEPAIVTLAILYVMVWGYLHLSGRIEEPIVAGLRRLVLLAVVLGGSLHLWLYNTLIVDTFYRAPAELASAVVGAPDPVATIDTIWSQGGAVAGYLWNNGGVFNGDFGYYVAGAIVWVLMGLVCVYTMFGSIRSVTASAVAAFEHLQAQRSRPFSVRGWVRQGRGVLFMPYRAPQIAALRSIIATWMRLAIFEAMRTPGEDQRLWFVVDELDSLGAIDGLKDALARLRKFGGRCVLGLQSVSQVSAIYGADAQTIVENCGTTLILRCAGSEHGGTSQFASRLIGEREVLRRQTSRGRDREGWFGGRHHRRSTQVSEQWMTETAVMASELEQLPDLTGFLKTPSSRAWLRVSFRP